MKGLVKASILLAGITTSASLASANVEIGGLAGVHVFNKNNELGVTDTSGGMTSVSERNGPLFGLRLSLMFVDVLGLEGELAAVPTEIRDMNTNTLNLGYRGNLILQGRGRDPSHHFLPFLTFGIGAMQVVKSDASSVVSKDADPAFFGGIGFKYRLDAGLGLRVDARLLAPPSSQGTKATVDFESFLSVYKEWGRTKNEIVVKLPPPPPADTDGDGLLDTVDKCPTEAEDKDAFQDDDGCPDLDNDSDGVPDTTDKCPLEAEDKDAFQDDDGCPDLDNDADGIADAADKCPIEAEDKDGFQDDDGCPEADNDGDGVLDAQDTCPLEPETKNGFKDDDGCPDELPAKVKQFTGVIKGINFKTGSDALLASSNKSLDKAILVLKEFPDLKLEIQGHTDDVPFKARKGGKFEDNTALSQGRAESVMAYFVKKGIDATRLTAKGFGSTQPVVDPTGLKGGKLNAARAKNRRVEFRLVSTLVP